MIPKLRFSNHQTKFYENLFSHSRAVPRGPMKRHNSQGPLYTILSTLPYWVSIYLKYCLNIRILQVTQTENVWCYLTNFSYNTAVASKVTQRPSVKHTTKPTSQKLAAINLPTSMRVQTELTNVIPHSDFSHIKTIQIYACLHCYFIIRGNVHMCMRTPQWSKICCKKLTTLNWKLRG